MLLHIGNERFNLLYESLGHMAVAIQRAGRISAVFQLRANRGDDLLGLRRRLHHAPIALAEPLAVADEYDRRSKEACVANETTGIADGASRVRQYREIAFGRKVGKCAEP